MNIIFFELPKFRKYLNCDIEKLTSIQRWGLFFLYADSKEHIGLIKKLALEERGIMFAMKILSKISISDWFWVQQKNYWDNISNIKSMKSTARNEGLAEGRAEGLLVGKAEGKAEGRAEGRIEGSIETKISNAKAFILLGKLSLDEIASCCNLSLEKVQELAQEIGK